MSAPDDPAASGTGTVRASHEPADVPAELDLSRRPRRRPPRQSEIRGINTIASLPPPPADTDDEDAAGGDRRG